MTDDQDEKPDPNEVFLGIFRAEMGDAVQRIKDRTATAGIDVRCEFLETETGGDLVASVIPPRKAK